MKYYQKNQKRLINRNKVYYQEHPEIHKAYYELHKEELQKKAYQKKIAKGWKPKTDFLYKKEICRFCKIVDGPFIKDGKYLACRKCCTKRAKAYRKTETGRKNVLKASYRTIKKFQYKQDARVLLNNHLKKGDIKKPLLCEKCNLELKLNGHHEDYSKPLEVMWLCRGCHADLHREKRMLE